MDALREVLDGLRHRIAHLRRMRRRATGVPMLLRLGVWLAGCVAMAVAYPAATMLSGGGLVLVLVALFAALWPRGAWPTIVILLAPVGWLASTTVYAQPVSLPRLVALAGSLYLVHNLAALAAQVPYDAIVSPGVVARWLVRAAAVIGLTAALAAVLLLAPPYLGHRTFLLAAVAGLAAMAALAMLLARFARR